MARQALVLGWKVCPFVLAVTSFFITEEKCCALLFFFFFFLGLVGVGELEDSDSCHQFVNDVIHVKY